MEDRNVIVHSNFTGNLPPILSSESPSDEKTDVNVGATLIIGSPQENPSGNYSGIFSVTFVVE